MSPTLFGHQMESITMKKPKKSGSEYYNHKGFFSLVLVALVNAKYRFFWVDIGSSGSSSDAEILNHSNLRKEIEDFIFGLLPPEPLFEGGLDLNYFLLDDNTFALMPWLLKPFSRKQHAREDRIPNNRISRGRWVVDNVFGILASGSYWAQWSKGLRLLLSWWVLQIFKTYSVAAVVGCCGC